MSEFETLSKEGQRYRTPTIEQKQAAILRRLMSIRQYIEDHAENPPDALLFIVREGDEIEQKTAGSRDDIALFMEHVVYSMGVELPEAAR